MGMAFDNTFNNVYTYEKLAEKLQVRYDTIRVCLLRKENIKPKKQEIVPQEIVDFLFARYGADVVQSTQANEVQTLEIQSESTTFQAEEPAKPAGFWAKTLAKIQRITYADAIIFIACSLTTYGLVSLFHIMGFVMALLYWLISFWVLSMAKDQERTGTAQMGVGFMWVLSAAAIYVHVSMFNNEIWAQADQMLFRPNPGDSAPFWTAFTLGILVFCIEIFAFESKRSETLEKAY